MIDATDMYGRGISFPPRVGSDGRVAWSKNEQNIRESIRIILLTEQNERLRLPDFGGGLGQFLFEPNTVATRHLIQTQINKALQQWEPRIKVQSVNVDPVDQDPQTALVTISYQLVATQTTEQVSLNITLATA